MFKISFKCFIFCVLAVHTGSRDVPKNRVGPFDEIDDESFSPPPKPAPHPQEGELFEGDIRVANRRIGAAGTTRVPWPKAVIPYRFDCSVENIPSAISATREAMKEWESKTCVRFVEKRPQDKAFLELFRAAGCWATYVGYRKDTKTQISIGSGCDYKHVMVHELGHVIGFWHEQSRSDRDNYINIQFSNVLPALRYNFDKVKEKTSHFGQSYDYGSIMHYPWNAFAINRRNPTIIAKRPLKGKQPYVKLSDSDAAQTKQMYKCSEITAGRASQSSYMRSPSIKKIVGNLVSDVSDCSDVHADCQQWAKSGGCDLTPDPMLAICRQSCSNCGPCKDRYRICKAWTFYGYCIKYPYYMFKNCKASCQICGTAPTERPTTERPTKGRKPPTKPPSKNTIRKPSKKYTGTRCVDRSAFCKEWQKDGRCKKDRWVMDNCLLSCKRFEICDAEPFKPIGSSCTSPLGVGWDYSLPDENFFATSVFSPGGGWSGRAHGGRLYREDDHAKKEIGAWCAHPRTKDQYLRIDLGRQKTITAVATQGRDRYFEHVKSYSLSFSNDNRNWMEYKENNEKKIFVGNCDHFTPVMNILQNRQTARYIRFHPVTYIGAMCLRVEVYGCS